MALETGTYISDLVTTNPPNTDGVSQADDHLRLIKSTVKATFPNITGAVTATHTQLNHVAGVTSAIQTQLDAKQPLDASLTAYAALTTAANKGIYYTGADTPATFDLSVYARTLLDDADATAARATLAAAGTGVANTFSAVQTFTASPIISVTDNTNAALRVTQLGTGLALRIEDEANPDSSPFVVDASGYVGIGTSTPSTYLGRASAVAPNDFAPSFVAVSNASASNWARIDLNNVNVATNTYWHKDSLGVMGLVNEGAHAMYFGTNNVERIRIDASGNVLVTGPGGLGYGTGSGGTVTQITSKSTGVTLNKTNGQIVTHNANLTAGSTVSFLVTNSTVAVTDTVIVHRASGGTNNSYIIGCDAVSAGSFRVYINNVSGAGIAEALTLNFAVIKAVTA